MPNKGPSVTVFVDPDNELGRYLTTPNVGNDALVSHFPVDGRLTVPFAAGTAIALKAGFLPKGVSPSPRPSTPGGGLPVTGVSMPLLLGTGGLLVLLGTMLVLLLRARRPSV